MFDKRIFLSESLADENSMIMTMYFVMNKKLDNLMDYLDIELDMNKFSERIHKIAHEFPEIADDFRDYNALHSYRSKYYGVDGQYKDFDNLSLAIEDILSYIVDIDTSLINARNKGMKEENYDFTKFIDEEIKIMRKYRGIFIALDDKIEAYLRVGNSYQDMDARIDDFFPEEEV